jgi:hypothetical protein
MVGGSYGLSIFMQTHFEYKDKREKNMSERKFNLEEERNAMIEKVTFIHKYELNIR